MQIYDGVLSQNNFCLTNPVFYVFLMIYNTFVDDSICYYWL